MRYIFICPSLPNKTGKGYEKILHHRLTMLPASSHVTLFICPPISFRKTNKSLVELKGYANLRIKVEFFHFTKTDVFIFLIKLLSAWPLQVVLHQRNSLNKSLKTFYLEHPETRVYCLLSRVFHKNICLFSYSILDYVDSMQLNFERRSATEKNIFLAYLWSLEAFRMKRWDRLTCRSVREALAVSQLDANYIDPTKVKVVPIGIDNYPFKPPSLTKRQNNIVFSGNMNYDPNIEAVNYFIDKCLFKLRKNFPDLQFHIVGRGISKKLSQQLEKVDGVVVVGEVLDMQSTLSNYPICVAPMQSGSGMQFKILEALTVGSIVVSSKLAADPFELKNIDTLFIAENDDDYVDYIFNILQDITVFEKSALEVQQLVHRHFSWNNTSFLLNTSCLLK